MKQEKHNALTDFDLLSNKKKMYVIKRALVYRIIHDTDLYGAFEIAVNEIK